VFHAKEGWYFERITDGGVRVLIQPHEYTPPTQTVEFDADTWASIVAAVSARGESREVWAEALALHHKK